MRATEEGEKTHRAATGNALWCAGRRNVVRQASQRGASFAPCIQADGDTVSTFFAEYAFGYGKITTFATRNDIESHIL